MACSAEHPLLTFQEERFGGKIWEALSWASTTVTSTGSPWHPTRLETNSKDREITRRALHQEGDLGRVGLGVTTVCSRVTRLLPLCRDEQHILNLDHMTTWERAFHDSDQTKPSHQRGQEYTSSPKTPKSKSPEVLASFLSAGRSKNVAHRTDSVTQTNGERKVSGFYHKDIANRTWR